VEEQRAALVAAAQAAVAGALGAADAVAAAVAVDEPALLDALSAQAEALRREQADAPAAAADVEEAEAPEAEAAMQAVVEVAKEEAEAPSMPTAEEAEGEAQLEVSEVGRPTPTCAEGDGAACGEGLAVCGQRGGKRMKLLERAGVCGVWWRPQGDPVAAALAELDARSANLRLFADEAWLPPVSGPVDG
jgi:hypothetical protein